MDDSVRLCCVYGALKGILWHQKTYILNNSEWYGEYYEIYFSKNRSALSKHIAVYEYTFGRICAK